MLAEQLNNSKMQSSPAGICRTAILFDNMKIGAVLFVLFALLNTLYFVLGSAFQGVGVKSGSVR